MSSILTNSSAMVALQTLNGINKNLAKVQSEISTGKSVGSAKDNAAIWAISKVMESDVKGFMAISESLSLGESTVAVATNASETVTDLLTDMKELITSGQQENVNRQTLQSEVNALIDQIGSVVGAAQFNGLNMLQGTDDVNVLASLDRASDGSVTASDIVVARQDLTFDAGVMGTGAALTGGVQTAGDAAVTGGNITIQAGAGQNFDDSSTRDFSNTANSMTVTVSTAQSIGDVFNLQVGGTTVSYTATTTTLNDVADGLTAAINAAGIEDITATVAGAVVTISSTSKFDDIEVNGSTTSATTQFSADVEGATATAAASSFTGANLQARASEITFSATNAVNEGDGYRVSIGGVNYDYIAGPNETFEDVAKGLKIAVDGAALADIETKVYQDATTSAWVLQVDNNGTALALSADGNAGGTATGGLAGLDNIDVTTDVAVDAALANIETFISNTIDAAAAFGSSASRIETQADFIGKLTDSLKTGIGTLVDADMEAASARLQALQVQQQLGIQSLSIANQAPQSILALFQ